MAASLQSTTSSERWSSLYNDMTVRSYSIQRQSVGDHFPVVYGHSRHVAFTRRPVLVHSPRCSLVTWDGQTEAASQASCKRFFILLVALTRQYINSDLCLCNMQRIAAATASVNSEEVVSRVQLVQDLWRQSINTVTRHLMRAI